MTMMMLPEGLSPEDVVALKLIADERARQRRVEGYDDRHDDGHGIAVFARAAAAYALATAHRRVALIPAASGCSIGELLINAINVAWPPVWGEFKPKDDERNLSRSGALLVAGMARQLRSGELTGCDRAESSQPADLVQRHLTPAEANLLETLLDHACEAASAADVSAQVFAMVSVRVVAAILAQFIEPADRQCVLELVIKDLRGRVADLAAVVDADPRGLAEAEGMGNA